MREWPIPGKYVLSSVKDNLVLKWILQKYQITHMYIRFPTWMVITTLMNVFVTFLWE